VFLVAEDGAYDLFVDGVNVTSCNDMAMAITLYFVSFYIFNLHFCTNSAKTVLFLQRYGLSIDDKTTDPFICRCLRACASVMEKLSRLVGGVGAIKGGKAGGKCSGKTVANSRREQRKKITMIFWCTSKYNN